MDIRDTALKYLAFRARTCKEMERHLRGKGYEDQEIEELIEDLQEVHYLDDADYCIQYFEYAFGKGKGRLRVKRELEEKGVDRDTIEIAFEDFESEETELERARKQAAKLAGDSPIDKKRLAKMGRRLTALGYGADIVYQVLGTYMRGQDD